MRVCFLNPHGYVEKHPPLGKTDTGGQTVYELELAKALGRQGIKVDIITRKFEKRSVIEEISSNVRIIRVPAGGENFVVKEKMYELIPEFVRNFMGYIEKNRIHYDLIHSHYWDGGFAGIKLAKKLKIPHVFTPHSMGKWKMFDMRVDEAPPQNLRKMYRYQVRIAAEQKIIDKSNVVLMISETQRIKLLQYYLIDFEKIQVIYPGVDTRVFNPIKSENSSGNGMTKKNRILLVSRFVPAKGIDRALDIFSAVVKKIDCTMYIATSNKNENPSDEERQTQEKINEIVEKNHLQDKVRFLGFVSDRRLLSEYYKKADVFLLPSRFEPFGLTTLEAMACGAVTMVSRVAGSRELIIDGVNGFIVDMHERGKTAKQIVSILNDKKLKKRISENGVMTVQKHYSWDIISKKISNLYATLIIK